MNYTAMMTLAAIDPAPLIQFYSQLLGRLPQPHKPGIYGEFQLPDLRLAIFKPRPEDEAYFHPQPGGAVSLCLQVEDLAAVLAHLQTLGCLPITGIIQASHGQEAYVHDPDGNRLILYQPS